MMQEGGIIENVELLQEQKPQNGLGMSTSNDSKGFFADLPKEDGDDESQQSHSSTGTDDNLDDSKTRASSLKIAHEESQKVERFRFILMVVLGLVGAGVCSGTYFFVRNETDMLSFELFSDSIETLLKNRMENLDDGMRNLGDTITASAYSTDKFPFVAVDKFETHGEHARDRSKMETITYAPLVNKTLKEEWEKWSVLNQNWIETSRTTFMDHSRNDEVDHVYLPGDIAPYIYSRRDGIFAEPASSDPYAPIWYLSPPPFNAAIVNFDILSQLEYKKILHQVMGTKRATFSPVVNVEPFTSLQISDVDHLRFHEKFTTIDDGVGYGQPHSLYAQPVFESSHNDNVAGFLIGAIAWDVYFADLLPEGVHGIICVLQSICGSQVKTLTFELDGAVPTFLGLGDYHDDSFNGLVRHVPLNASSERTEGQNSSVCEYWVDIYPSETFADDSNIAYYAVATVGATFAIVALIFFIYDSLVKTRNNKVTAAAERSLAVVSSLFPKNVRDRLMEGSAEHSEEGESSKSPQSPGGGPKSSKSIAEFFPKTTIMFADIAGFTAWSSTPKRRRVFKVETVGDCYVAACGLPEPQKDHAVIMARFARDCLFSTRLLTKKLECTLGPDTADLAMRIGLHSGPITAGVLRGDNARYQLFGDTMNTTARVESNGMRDRIHISQETADLLISAGKLKWLEKREDAIYAKGKGRLETYWLDVGAMSRKSSSSSAGSVAESSMGLTLESGDAEEYDIGEASDMSIPDKKVTLDRKTMRLVEWNSSVLTEKLRQILAERNKGKPDGTDLPPEVAAQIYLYVTEVASRYHSNPFHNFEHASHVTMSVVKLLSRVVATEEDIADKNYTKGIASDFIVQFGIILSAIIHDMDHLGVPNSQLIVEKPAFAAKYNNKSIAENNSIALAWGLLEQPGFEAFRQCLAPSDAEWQKLHETVVNATLATDIVNQDLKADRNARWVHAFKESAGPNTDELKVRIVLEHMIQASDVSHTMQHWHIYRKWNERLFEEMYKAFCEGRATKNPSEFWYEGEKGFFDFYIIPLARKLHECQCFGVSSDEYLNYALQNRKEWEERGQEVVASMIQKFKSK